MPAAKKTILYQTPNKTVSLQGKVVVKEFDETYPKYDVLNEALNQARVEQTDLNIPKVQAVTVEEGKWCIKMDYVKGKTLQQLMDENPEKVDLYLNMFVDLQVEVQSKKVPLLPRLKDKMQAKISQTSYDATTRYELHVRLDSIPKHLKLCHGDFTPGNIIITPEGKAFVIDWSHATQGNASLDAARTFLTFNLEGKSDLADKYLALFCKKTDTAKQYIQRLMPIVAATQSLKAKPEEKGLLSRWVNVVEYE